jgi:hypothetical protein
MFPWIQLSVHEQGRSQSFAAGIVKPMIVTPLGEASTLIRSIAHNKRECMQWHPTGRVAWYINSVSSHKGQTQTPGTVMPQIRFCALSFQSNDSRKILFHYCVFFPYRGNNVSTDLLPSKGCCAVACLHSCYLATGLHVTILHFCFMLVWNLVSINLVEVHRLSVFRTWCWRVLYIIYNSYCSLNIVVCRSVARQRPRNK